MANARDRAEARGLAAAALFALTPSVALFAFTLDALIGCLAAWTLVLVARRLGGGAAWQIIAAGALLAFNSFLSFGALASGATIVLAFALWFASRVRTNRMNRGFSNATSSGATSSGATSSGATSSNAALLNSKSSGETRAENGATRQLARRVFLDLALCALGFFAVWLLLCALLPMQPIAIYERAMQAHHAATGNRSRWNWAVLNLGMFALFCGWPVALACLSRAIRLPKLAADSMRVASSEKSSGGAADEAARIVGMATLWTLLLLTLSGNVRGEVERLWMFALVPLCALASLGASPSESSRMVSNAQMAGTPSRAGHEYFALIALLFLQVVQCVLMTGALAPLIRPF